MSAIPEHAKRVFKGVIFDVYQWEQEMFDGSIEIFEGLKRPNTVMVIPMIGDRVYYAYQEQPSHEPFLSLLGGRGDEGEAPLETAKRELLEEAGLESDEWVELRKYSIPGKFEWDVYYFVARNCRKTANQSLDCGEKIEIREIDLDGFLLDIVAEHSFREHSFKREVFSAFNPDVAAKLRDEIIG
jgi:ADP-ribose pyrophosphatase